MGAADGVRQRQRRPGAEHLEEVLGWCSAAGIRHVTVFVASIDNVTKRAPAEVGHLMRVIEEAAATWSARPAACWRTTSRAASTYCPARRQRALKLAREATLGAAADSDLTFAIGYDGRVELIDAVRSLLDDAARSGTTLAELAERLTPGDIAAHLYTRDLPDPDLVIRTSGERRLSGFLLWQSAYSDLYFCDVYWPGFRHVDFLRALRSYAGRHER